MLKFLYIDGTVRRRKFGTNLHKMKVNGARPLVVEYDEVDWDRVEKTYKREGMSIPMQDYWFHGITRCIDESITIPLPKKIKDIMYPPREEATVNPFLEAKEEVRDSLVEFYVCSICGSRPLTGSPCICGNTGKELTGIRPRNHSKGSISDEVRKQMLSAKKEDKAVEDRSMECVGCQ